MAKNDCNCTAEFFKTLLRTCRLAEDNCKGCPFEKCTEAPYNSYNCQDFIQMHTKDAIQLLQQWSDKHPEETLLNLFKKDHPKAPLWNGVPGCDPIVLGYLPETMRDFVNSTGTKIWEIPIDELEKVSACKTSKKKTVDNNSPSVDDLTDELIKLLNYIVD